MRWQLVWSGGTNDDRNNLTKYDEWLNWKLNQTDYLLAACIKYLVYFSLSFEIDLQRYGIKAVVDLHTPPGARDPIKGDLFLINQTYQNHFYEISNM